MALIKISGVSNAPSPFARKSRMSNVRSGKAGTITRWRMASAKPQASTPSIEAAEDERLAQPETKPATELNPASPAKEWVIKARRPGCGRQLLFTGISSRVVSRLGCAFFAYLLFGSINRTIGLCNQTLFE